MRNYLAALLVSSAACGQPDVGSEITQDEQGSDSVPIVASRSGLQPADSSGLDRWDVHYPREFVAPLVTLDSTGWETDGGDSGYVFAIGVERPDGAVDTIRDVLTSRRHVTVDAQVSGLSLDSRSGVVTGRFVFNPSSGEVQSARAPEGIGDELAFSPDGRHLAYVARTDSGHAAVILEWPSTNLLYRGNSVAGYPSDAVQGGQVAWRGDAFQFIVRTNHFGILPGSTYRDGLYVRTMGRIDPWNVRIDTVRTREPQ